MEKTSTKYLLMATLLGVWGLVAYRFYQRANPAYEFPAAAPPNEAALLNDLGEDSFDLLLSYGNPFSLGYDQKPAPSRMAVKAVIPKAPPSAPKAPELKPAQKPIVFPEVSYKGNIKLKSGRTAALVSVGSDLANLGVGETLNEVTLIKIYEDSIKIRFQKSEKVILKARQ